MVLTIGLFAVVLGVLASLLTDSMQVTRRADELSWSNRAAHWLDQMEMSAASARVLNVAAGGSETELVAQLREIKSPGFLPDPPPDPWSPDLPAHLETRTFKIQSGDLVLSVGASTFLLGQADSLTVERSNENILTLTIVRADEKVRREVPLLLLDSERAPL